MAKAAEAEENDTEITDAPDEEPKAADFAVTFVSGLSAAPVLVSVGRAVIHDQVFTHVLTGVVVVYVG